MTDLSIFLLKRSSCECWLVASLAKIRREKQIQQIQKGKTDV